MNAQRTNAGRAAPHRGFTLAELLVVIMIISILASTVLFTMFQAVQKAKESRAQTQVAKLNELLMARWEAYRTRSVRLLQVSAPGTLAQPVSVIRQVRKDPRAMAVGRLNAIRDLMRMEMPDRVSDVVDVEVTHIIPYFQRTPTGLQPVGNVEVKVMRPSLSSEYYRRANTTAHDINDPTLIGINYWTTTHQGAECLYLIVASMRDITSNGLDFLQEGEVGDVDGDGMQEILDPWGNPIEFLRWAPGYVVSPGSDGQWGVAGTDDDGNGQTDDFWEAWDRTSTPGKWIAGGYGDDLPMITPMVLTPDPTDITKAEITDSFNPLRIDAGQMVSGFADSPRNFALYPLIFSAGPDEKYDINVMGNDPPTSNNPFRYANIWPRNHPYHVPDVPSAFPAGTPMDTDLDGELSFMDNITNHGIETR